MVTSLGKQFPVDIKYESVPKEEPIAISASRFVKRALKDQQGDILVFLPGAGEIKRAQEILETEIDSASIFPLFGDLPFQKQQEAIFPNQNGLRKVVLA